MIQELADNNKGLAALEKPVLNENEKNITKRLDEHERKLASHDEFIQHLLRLTGYSPTTNIVARIIFFLEKFLKMPPVII